jgi:hypothetical protein
MEKQNKDSGMGRDQSRAGKGGAASPAYGLAAIVLWALVLYSLSPFSRPQPARLAARAVQLCDR